MVFMEQVQILCVIIRYKVNDFRRYLKSIIIMQTRANKVFLPQSYEDYMAQKKKLGRHLMHKHSSKLFQSSLNPTLQPKDNNFMSHSDTYRSSIRSVRSVHNDSRVRNNLSPQQNIRMQVQSDSDDDSQNYNPNKKEVQIVEKIAYSEYKNLFDEFENNKFESIKKKIEQELERLRKDTPLQPLKVNQILKKIQLQSLENITQIQKELQFPSGKRNSQKLDQMLSFNKFFVILNKEKRYRIYQNCTLRKCQPNQIVYKEGQLNEYMFIVVKGCVKQYETKSTSYQEKVQVNFVSYYEGSNFGQAPLIGDAEIKGKRYNTTVATEETYLLQMNNNFYKELITNSAQDDFEKKIQALMETSIFRQTSKMFVTPILPTLTKHALPYGTVLIRQEQQVRNLYFVAQGNFQILFLDRARRNVKHRNIEEKPKNFYIKKSETKSKTASSKQKPKSYSIHTKFYYPQTSQQAFNKEFIYGNKKIVGENQIEYNQQIVFQTLRLGDFFGGKSFLQEIQREKKMMNSEYFDTSLKAKLSVVCSSPRSVVYSIDEKKFFSLSDNFQKMIIQGIMETKYFDEHNIDIKVDEQKQWKKYTQKLVTNVIAAKKNTRSSSFRM